MAVPGHEAGLSIVSATTVARYPHTFMRPKQMLMFSSVTDFISSVGKTRLRFILH